jgi:4-amino-4-deoxy-L-arabinose transferase-like glycosyltransferase
MNNSFVKFGLVACMIFFVLFFSTYKLSESPQTWIDEGLIIQTSQNLVTQGVYGFQISPGTLISPSFISTSYPVTFPIAASFWLFGVGLLQARIIMALFIMALVISLWFFIKENSGWASFLPLLLIITFPPLYGQGKNVLGEVPGLFFLILATVFLQRIEQGKRKLRDTVLFGLFSGICIATKPIFIVLLPGFLLVCLLLYRKNLLKKDAIWLLAASFCIPIWGWIHFQFQSSDSIQRVLGYYSNPHSLNVFNTIVVNLRDFLSHGHTLFAGLVFMLWTVVFLRSAWNKQASLSETFLYVFSVLIWMNYFRNPPYYRYFFVAEVISLIFFIRNIYIIPPKKSLYKYCTSLFLVILIGFQLYGILLGSWVASAYQSHRTLIMRENIEAIPPTIPVFVYQSPEAVVFLKHTNYYQYFSGTPTTEFGKTNLTLLEQGKPFLILTKADLVSKEPLLFSHYHVVQTFDRYVLLTL